MRQQLASHRHQPCTQPCNTDASEACKSKPYLLASRYWQAVSPCLPPATLLAPRNWPVACNVQRTYLHGCKLQGRYLPRSVVALTLAPSWTSLRMVRACTRSSQPTNRLSAPAAAKCCAAPSASVSQYQQQSISSKSVSAISQYQQQSAAPRLQRQYLYVCTSKGKQTEY